MSRNSGGGRVSSLDGQAPDGQDFANYFCTYAYLYHQKDMLEDHKRTGAYYNAVMHNRRQFIDKVVLDVGTGSGILAIFSALAGARKVYAVEATDMAKHARRLVEHNKLSDVVEVIQGTVESVELPEKVDIIISEWMGYFLLRESMLDSVLLARDRFLKPGGALYPSHARMFMAPIRTHVAQQRENELHGSMDGWGEFLQDMQSYYNVDLSCLSVDFKQEQRDYYMSTSAWTDTHPSQLIGAPAPFKSYDLLKVTVDELKAGIQESFELTMTDPGPVDAFTGWFDVSFKGSPEQPADSEVVLSTAPDPTGATHWGQQTFYIAPALGADKGDKLLCTIDVQRRKDNHRLLEVKMGVQVAKPGAGAPGKARELRFNIE